MFFSITVSRFWKLSTRTTASQLLANEYNLLPHILRITLKSMKRCTVTCEVLRSVYLAVLAIQYYRTIETFCNTTMTIICCCFAGIIVCIAIIITSNTEIVTNIPQVRIKIADFLPFYLRSVCGAGITSERPLTAAAPPVGPSITPTPTHSPQLTEQSE
jgi:hypothetical protein